MCTEQGGCVSEPAIQLPADVVPRLHALVDRRRETVEAMAAHVFGVGFSIAGRAREIDSKEQLLAKRRSYSESTWNPSQTRSDVAAYYGITDRHLRRLSDEFGVGFDALPPVQTAMLPATLRHLMNMGFVSARIDRSAVARWIEEFGTDPRRLSRAELRRTEGICQVSCT